MQNLLFQLPFQRDAGGDIFLDRLLSEVVSLSALDAILWGQEVAQIPNWLSASIARISRRDSAYTPMTRPPSRKLVKRRFVQMRLLCSRDSATNRRPTSWLPPTVFFVIVRHLLMRLVTETSVACFCPIAD